MDPDPCETGNLYIGGISEDFSRSMTRQVIRGLGDSLARRNRYRLPDEGPLERWRASGARVLSTADAGAVWLRTNGAGVRRVDWR